MAATTSTSGGATGDCAPLAADSHGERWDLLGELRTSDYEKIVICNERRVGLQAIICVHSTLLGPANGGVRMHPYATTDEALKDVMRLARAMTYKWSAAGENRGGGKAVIIGDPRSDKTEALLRAFGRCVDRLRGEYYVGEDVGITLSDMEVIHLETDYVATLPTEAGGVGDIAPATACGAIHAMSACAQRVWGTPDLAGRTVALQGLGACGSAALGQLLAADAVVRVTDIDPAKVQRAVAEHGVETVEPDAIYDLETDIFAPFAMGGVLNERTIPRLRAKVVAGSANNVFADELDAAALERNGIVYAPDFIANAGGAIYDADQFRKGGFCSDRVSRNIARIEERVREVFALAERHGETVQAAAYRLAEQRLTALAPLRRAA
jgi:leucine dehydrogenase